MSIIQQIREKAAWLVFGLIALSLVGFLLMDAFVGRSRIFGGGANVVGVVDGKKLEYVDFQKQIAEREDQAKSQGFPVNESMQQGIKEEVWNDFVEDAVMSDIYRKLALEISDKELADMLSGPNAIPEIRRSFTDPKTGIFDQQQATATINELRTIYIGNKKTNKNFENARRLYEELIPNWIKARQKAKYLALLSKSAYVPKWMIEKGNAENSQIASISYVSVPYSTIADSVAKPTDAEIEDYVSKHKDQFQQKESRSIVYVTFNAAPTSEDSAAIRQQLKSLKAEFAATNDVQGFLSRNVSEIGFFDSYVPKSKMQMPLKDSIIALPKGAVLGPYLDGGNFNLAKKIDEKNLPDSVRARHILIATVDPRSGQPILEDSVARKRIDSIKLAIDKGANFDSLALKLSDDAGSKVKGGDLGFFTQGQMVKEFNDFVFMGKKGDRGIVKTQYGYHLIEITDQRSFEQAYKVAYLSKKIEASQTTDETASGLANKFAGESRTAKAFEENRQKQGFQRFTSPEIQPTDYSIPGLGTSRQLIRWIFDANLGEVSEPFGIGDKYIVAAVAEINQKGIMPVSKARPIVEPILRNQKKADLIIKKIGDAKDLQAIATATGQPVQKADSINFTSPYIPKVGQEAKVVGAAFDKDLQGKSVSAPIEGNAAVYVIKVENVSAVPNYAADINQQRSAMLRIQESQIQNQAIQELKKDATIKDSRGKFY
ncbi:MAG: hypothetical protein C5B59_04830 [Bacteroidetes bacterium]|nr:MAG: hypothetical protein C5B59_04830 [Bacteroidota bacterium]